MTRRIMREFTLHEISAVDRPAQEGATVKIMKRDDKGERYMTTKTVEQLAQELADVNKRLETSTSSLASAQAQAQKSEDALSKARAEFERTADGLKDQIRLLKARAEMKDEEKDYADRIEDEDDRKKFIFSSPAEKWVTLKKAEESDETIKVNNTVVRKSVVGASQFAMMKAQQATIDALNKSQTEAVERAETADLTKMAEDQFSQLPGTLAAKVAALRFIDKIGEQVVKVKDDKGNEIDVEVRKTIYAMLGAGNKATKAAFGRIGTNRDGDADIGKNGPSAFEKRLSEVEAANPKLAKTDAMRKARLEYPKEFAEYQAAGENAGQMH